MGIVAKEIFTDQLAKPAQIELRNQVAHIMRAHLLNLGPGNRAVGDVQLIRRLADQLRNNIAVNREDAETAYDQIRQYIRRVGYLPGKYLRSWDIDTTIYTKLDRTQPWWGFEFETGYRSQEARAEVIDHVWDTWDNVVFDSEGEDVAVEITFAPQEMQKYLDGTADAFKFVEYLTGNRLVSNTGNSNVGTHINLSHPAITRENVANVGYSLARSIAALPVMCKIDGKDADTRRHMFGRADLYGGFFAQRTETAVWIEGKLFRTAYDVEVFKRYVKVCECLTKLAELFSTLKPEGIKYPYVDNLLEMYRDGAEPNVVFGKYFGNIDGTRGNNLLNGSIARDRWNEPPPSEPAPKDRNEELYTQAVEEYGYDYVANNMPPDGQWVDGVGGIWCVNCNEYHDE